MTIRTMNEHEIHAHLRASGIDGVGGIETSGRDPFVVLEPAALVPVMTFLRDDPACAMEMLHLVTVVQRETGFEVVYHVCSYARHHSLTLKIVLSRPEGADAGWTPAVPSVASVYPSADWHEREQYDLFGVHFEGHPDLRRILLPEEWIGHPLRKDYVYPSHAGEIPLELDATPIYEREGRPADPVRPPREAGTPLTQPPSAPSERPHAGGKAPPPKSEGEAKPARKGHGAAAGAKDDSGAGKGDAKDKSADAKGKGAGDASGGQGGDAKADMAAKIAAIKAAKAKKDKEGGT